MLVTWEPLCLPLRSERLAEERRLRTGSSSIIAAAAAKHQLKMSTGHLAVLHAKVIASTDADKWTKQLTYAQPLWHQQAQRVGGFIRGIFGINCST